MNNWLSQISRWFKPTKKLVKPRLKPNKPQLNLSTPSLNSPRLKQFEPYRQLIGQLTAQAIAIQRHRAKERKKHE